MRKIIFSGIVFLVILALGFFCGYVAVRYITASQDEIQVGNVERSDEKEPESKADTANDTEVSPEDNLLIPLKEGLQGKIKDYDGEWAVYVEDLKSGDYIEINNKKMVSASLIKLFIMGKTFLEIESGTIDKEKVLPYLKDMITVSDNEASNILVARLGGGKYTDMYDETFKAGLKQINDYAKGIDCNDTEQQRDMKSSRPKPIPEQNYTSVSDCGKLLSRLYHKKLVSDSADSEMLELLKRQTRTSKIPAGLPKGTVCANKTGELSDVENDTAIVFSPGADYVICVMSNNVPYTSNARKNITEISKTVYNFFNS